LRDLGFWVRRGVWAFAVWLVICAGAAVFGNRPDPGLVAAGVLTVGLATTLALDADRTTTVLDWRLPMWDAVRDPGRDGRLDTLARMVTAHLVSHDVTDQLPRHLVALADHRLIAHHGVSRIADPERAARLMGPELSRLAAMAEDGRRVRMTSAQIDALIDRIEEL
jgi:hypothetical protein